MYFITLEQLVQQKKTILSEANLTKCLLCLQILIYTVTRDTMFFPNHLFAASPLWPKMENYPSAMNQILYDIDY